MLYHSSSLVDMEETEGKIGLDLDLLSEGSMFDLVKREMAMDSFIFYIPQE